MRKLKVAVLFGGKSSEHEVSIISAKSVMDNLDKEKFEIIPVKIAKNGKFSLPKILSAEVIFSSSSRRRGRGRQYPRFL